MGWVLSSLLAAVTLLLVKKDDMAAVVQERSGFGGAQVKDVSCSPGEDLGVLSHLTAGGGQTWAVRSQSINSLNSLCVCVAGLLFVCVLEFYSLRFQGQITWM